MTTTAFADVDLGSQLKAIFGEMLHVMPDIEAGEPELMRSGFIHGIKRMPCSFTARD